MITFSLVRMSTPHSPLRPAAAAARLVSTAADPVNPELFLSVTHTAGNTDHFTAEKVTHIRLCDTTRFEMIRKGNV